MNKETNSSRKTSAALAAAERFAAGGYRIAHDFLTAQECEYFLSLIEEYRLAHDVPQIRRSNGRSERSLNYRVIDGLNIKKYLPEIRQLYVEVNQTVNAIAGENLSPLKNEQVGVNVNITPPGGEYRWHYDRNRLTGILYLNTVEGGETECYPNYRLSLGKTKFSKFQQAADKLLELKWVRSVFGKQVLLTPQQGTLVLMRADKCLHSVRRVLGDKDRINIILSYDAPDTSFVVDERLGNYLYNQSAATFSDPNYK